MIGYPFSCIIKDMFRRRRIIPAGQPGRAVFEQELIRAHQMYEASRFDEAGAIFERLAEIAAARNGPRAPRFYLEAGRCWMHTSRIDYAMQLMEQGHQLALQKGRIDLIQRLCPLLQIELAQQGWAAQSQQVAGWLKAIPALPIIPADETHQKKPALPVKCPSCGASVNPQTVNWLDQVTAECDFCGSSIQGK